jgi:4-hydroxy-tetrahydrodipicolinate synthase
VVLSGDDLTYTDLLQAGAKGTISVTANVAPRALHDVCAAALKGEFTRARELDSTLRLLHNALFLEANPIPVKWAVARLGLMEDGIRLPLTKLQPRFYPQLMEAIAAAGIRFA